MEIKRLDASPFLLDGEKVEVKITTKKVTLISFKQYFVTLLGYSL